MVNLQVKASVACCVGRVSVPGTDLTSELVPFKNTVSQIFGIEALGGVSPILDFCGNEPVLAGLQLGFVYVGVDRPTVFIP